jgi:hypothetical protein
MLQVNLTTQLDDYQLLSDLFRPVHRQTVYQIPPDFKITLVINWIRCVNTFSRADTFHRLFLV